MFRVDRSKLPPLEHFVSAEFLESEKQPEEWLQETRSGFVPFLETENHEWMWKGCW